MSNSLSTKKILKVICEGVKRIQTKGKHVIIFIAVSQTGKTTTINVLSKGSGIINDNGEFKMINSDSTNLGATGGAAGVSRTILPETYTVDNLCILDIQGYNDTRSAAKVYGEELNREEIQIVASILTEMSIRLTSSISAVLILKYGNFTFKGMQESGEMINRLFNSIQLPIFILFNRFQHESRDVMKEYYQTEGNEEISFVKNFIKNQADIMEKAKSEASNTEYFDLIKKNIDDDNFSYINIESQETIDINKSRIGNLPKICKEQIKFDNSSELRVKFNDLCKSMLNQWLKYLKRSYLMKIYSLSFFDGALREIPSTISELKGQMKSLSENKEFNSQNEISLHFNNIIGNMRNEKSRKEGERNKAENQITEYQNQYLVYFNKYSQLDNKITQLTNILANEEMKKAVFQSSLIVKNMFMLFSPKPSSKETTSDIRKEITETKGKIEIYKDFLNRYDNERGEYLKNEKTFRNDSYFVNNTYTFTYSNSFSRYTESLGSDVYVVWRTVKKNFYQAKFEARAIFHAEMYINIKFYENNRSRYEDEIEDHKEKLESSENHLEYLQSKLNRRLEDIKNKKIINNYDIRIAKLKKEKNDVDKEKNKMKGLENQYDKLHTETKNKFNSLKNDIINLEKNITQKENEKNNVNLIFTSIKYFEKTEKCLKDKKKKIVEFINENKKVDDQKISEDVQSCIDICKILEVNKDIINNIEIYQKKINEFTSSSQFHHKINSETVNGFSYKKDISFNQNGSYLSLSSFESKFDADLNNF